MMKAMSQLFVVFFILYFCERVHSAPADIKRSIVDAPDAALFINNMQSPCDTTLANFTERQRNICYDSFSLTSSVIKGAGLARQECIKQFKNDRWDCTGSPRTFSMLGLMTNVANREAAFNHALIAAGTVHVLARDCMMGDIKSCHCSRAKRPQSIKKEYIWGGCGDNIRYAIWFSSLFMDDPRVEKINSSTDKKLAEKLLIDRHNAEVGREAVLKHRLIICKCHGNTGDCTIKTCWYQVREFKYIGDYLKEKQKYRSAIKVKLVSQQAGKQVALKEINDGKIDLSKKNNLIYTEDSPKYCDKNLRDYSPGTAGRECNASTIGLGSCDYLCCGRGYKTRRTPVQRQCNCQFQWCCNVICQTCTKVMMVHTCN